MDSFFFVYCIVSMFGGLFKIKSCCFKKKLSTHTNENTQKKRKKNKHVRVKSGGRL